MNRIIKWDYTEGLIRELLANENWGVMSAADAQEQSNRRVSLVEKIKKVFDELAEKAWMYRDLRD